MFKTLCENKMAFLTDCGYSLWLELSSTNYERIVWKNRDVIISIDHTNYESALELDIYVCGRQVDINKLFSDLGLSYTSARYEYTASGMENGIAYFAEALDILINVIFLQDYDSLKQELENQAQAHHNFTEQEAEYG